ncbi:MAG: VCBS repeat-containing protein [Cyanobacteria bacterium P01_F01_bin.143]
MLVTRDITRSPFSEVDSGSIATPFTINGITPRFIELGGQSFLIAAGQRETRLFLPDTNINSIFSGEIDLYVQIEGGKYLETDLSSAFAEIETGARIVDFTVADFNNDGIDEIINSFDESEPPALIGDGILRYYQLDANGVYRAAAIDSFAQINQENGSKFQTVLDVNGDGFLDVVVTSGDRETPNIFLNTNNGATFEPFTGATNLPPEIDLSDTGNIYSVDGDRDGDLDLVLKDETGNLIFFRYQNGIYTRVADAENPFIGVAVSGELAFRDVDSDGDIDVLGIGFATGEVNYYENIAIANDNPPVAANDTFEVLGRNPQELDVLRNDLGFQDRDISLISFSATSALGGTITQRDDKLVYTASAGITAVTEDSFEYIIQDSAGRTDIATVRVNIFPQFFFQRVADANPFAYLDVGDEATPELADIDGDGDLDLISGNEEAEIRYFRNDNGLLVAQTGIDNPFDPVSLGGRFANDSALAFADYDQDGDLDFIAGSDAVRDDGQYFYFQNNSGIYFDLFGPTNPVQTISDLEAHLVPVAVDWDRDGDQDLVVGSDELILYFQNNNGILQEVTATQNPFQAFNIAEEDSDLDLGAEISVNFFDFDGDGDLDLISGNRPGDVFAFRNDGDRWTKLTGKNHPLGGDIDLEDDVTIGRGDVDNDGDDDLIIGKANGTFLYWESLLISSEIPQTLLPPAIPDSFPQTFTLQEAGNNPFSNLNIGDGVAPELVDIDGDGDLDLISGNEDAEIRYFLNQDGNFSEQTGVNNPFNQINLAGFLIDDSAVTFADYDSDGDLDFVAVSERVSEDGEYFYFQNNGSSYTQLFGANNPIRTVSEIDPTLKPTAIDWDQDGDPDLVVGYEDFIRYFENNGGILQEVEERANPFRFFNLVEDDSDAPLNIGSEVSLSFFDFDSDQDLDLLAGNRFGDILAFQNDGNGWTALTEDNHPLGGDINVDFVGKIAQGDLDLDGDTDFVIGVDDGNILYWENQPNVLNTPINRFQNSSIPGTYLFAGEAESQAIRANFPNFVEEGLAFKVATEPGGDLIPLYRFQSNVTPGTYLFTGEEERVGINENFANDFTEEGLAFYVYPGGSGQGSTFYRFQNQDRPGTYLFAGEAERAVILSDFPSFIEEGIAFEVGI